VPRESANAYGCTVHLLGAKKSGMKPKEHLLLEFDEEKVPTPQK